MGKKKKALIIIVSTITAGILIYFAFFYPVKEPEDNYEIQYDQTQSPSFKPGDDPINILMVNDIAFYGPNEDGDTVCIYTHDGRTYQTIGSVYAVFNHHTGKVLWYFDHIEEVLKKEVIE